jgi:type II secretory ATPase GspE/PulE/Tfp pilus assembly ATPase PilB-like protein
MSNPIGRISWHIVTDAIKAQASQVQIKLEGGRMLVYHRTPDGVHEAMKAPGHIFPPVVTRYKLWADVDLLKRRYPVEGQFALVYGWRHYTVDLVWEELQEVPTVTLSIVAGSEAEVEWDGPYELHYVG